MEPIKANIGITDNLANLKNWQDMFGELAKGYIDPAEPRKLAPDQSWGAGIGKLVHKYAFDMPASIVVNAAKLFDKGSKDPLSVAPLEYTASVADALLAATPGGGTGVANIGKRDALRQIGRAGIFGAKYRRNKSIQTLDELMSQDFPEYKASMSVINKGYAKAKESIRQLLQTANKLPQKEWDRINKITWSVDDPFVDYWGAHFPTDRKIDLSSDLFAKPKKGPDTLIHEMTHARQWVPDKSLSEMVKASALRKARNDFEYKYRPIEQLARATAEGLQEGSYLNFEEAYTNVLDDYLRTAKQYRTKITTDAPFMDGPYQGQWDKLYPHLAVGLELAKKVPTAKKQINRLSKIAAKADEIEASLRGKPGDPNKAFDLMLKANRLKKRANQQQVQYYKILQEFGIE